MLVRSPDGFIQPQAIIRAICAIIPQDMFRTSETMTILYWLMLVAGVSTLFGLATRSSAFVFALSNWIMIAHRYSYGEKHHTEALWCIFLLLLAMSPSGRCLSFDALIRRSRSSFVSGPRWGVVSRDKTVTWPLTLIQVIMSLSYLNAGVCKLHTGGLTWLNGYTLQGHVFTDAVRWERPIGLWLAQQHGLCIGLSVFTVLFEVFFFLALIVPRAVPFILIGGVALHTGICLTQGAPFFATMILYCVFIDFDRLFGRNGKRKNVSG
jgi:uncharacterized membrane protein YphA (DoxX/SURF4 family)